MSIRIESPAFAEGKPIPRKYTEDGEDISPPLSWTAPPAGTVELALIVDDPDAPVAEPWVHWVAYKIPAAANGLPEGFHVDRSPGDAPTGMLQGQNTWPTTGYRGPAPPRGHGVHHYHFKLFALDAALDLPPGLNKHDLQAAMAGHILARGELVGTYQR